MLVPEEPEDTVGLYNQSTKLVNYMDNEVNLPSCRINYNPTRICAGTSINEYPSVGSIRIVYFNIIITGISPVELLVYPVPG